MCVLAGTDDSLLLFRLDMHHSLLVLPHTCQLLVQEEC